MHWIKQHRTWMIGTTSLLAILTILYFHHFVQSIGPFPEAWNLGLRGPVDNFQVWVIANRSSNPVFTHFFQPFSASVEIALRAVERALLWFPWPVMVLGLALLGYRLAGWRVAGLTTACIALMGLLGLWNASMQTLALMLISVIVSLVIGIPLGILAARSDRFERVVRPLLDAMQTMPAFVYLIPVLLFFGVARVPSVVATVIYAVPPALRLTNLGIRQVSAETIEAARAFGSTSRQILFKVQLPLALPAIMAGVNQTIMMALGIVVIAALIGAGGLGNAVLSALRRIEVGAAMEAGLAIVFLAIVLDRLSLGLSQVRRSERLPGATGLGAFVRRHAYLIGSLAFLTLVGGLSFATDSAEFPTSWYLPLRQPVDHAVAWMRDNLYTIHGSRFGTGPLSDFITIYCLTPLRLFLQQWLAWPVIILAVSGVAWILSSWRLALASVVGLLFMGALGMWDLAMDTLSQVLVAVLVSVMIGMPLGLWAAYSDRAEHFMRPVLDFLQTIPPFVYLVPVIMLFNVGRVPGIIASVLYAIPPTIRLTSLGIRQVDPATVEAARSFGSTGRQMLGKVQFPLALPTIMLGISQTIMMVLAMVIIAGLVGGGGLGLEAIIGLAQNQTGRGIEAGLAIVIMAIITDRLTQAWALRRARAVHLAPA